jgi:hypothetical protein
VDIGQAAGRVKSVPPGWTQHGMAHDTPAQAGSTPSQLVSAPTHLGRERISILLPSFRVTTMSPQAPTPRPMLTTLDTSSYAASSCSAAAGKAHSRAGQAGRQGQGHVMTDKEGSAEAAAALRSALQSCCLPAGSQQPPPSSPQTHSARAHL